MALKLKLSKSLQSKEKINDFRNEILGELKKRPHLRLNQMFVQDIYNTVEESIKPKYVSQFNIDKQSFCENVIIEAYELNDDEIAILKSQIQYLKEKKLIKKLWKVQRLGKYIYKKLFL